MTPHRKEAWLNDFKAIILLMRGTDREAKILKNTKFAIFTDEDTEFVKESFHHITDKNYMYSPKLKWNGSLIKSSGLSPHDLTIN